MQKILNDPLAFVDEMLEGVALAHPDQVRLIGDDHRGVVRSAAPVSGKVAIATGGGSGHLPVFMGYVGEGLADGAAIGNVFASPSADQMLEVTRAVSSGAGVLYVYGNYGGDVMNFDLAAELAAAEGLAPQKVYWTATPRSVIESGFEAFAKSEDNPFAGVEKPEDIPFGTPDDQIAARIDARDFADHKLGALHAHATQIPPRSWLYVLAGSFGADFLGIEHFTLARGVKGPAGEESGLEDDLFAGVELPVPLPS